MFLNFSSASLREEVQKQDCYLKFKLLFYDSFRFPNKLECQNQNLITKTKETSLRLKEDYCNGN